MNRIRRPNLPGTPSRRALALEPRLLFDGAAATAVDHQAAADAHHAVAEKAAVSKVALTPQATAANTTPNVDVTLNPGRTDPASSSVLIGENFTVGLSFSNSGTASGYGPYVDVYVKSNDAAGDNGLTLAGGSATYLGQPVKVTAIVLGADADSGTAGLQYAHPFATQANGSHLVTAPTGYAAGDTVYVIELPFGSYTPGQPAAQILIGGHVDNKANFEQPLGITAVAGFRYGQDALANYATDPTIISSTPKTLTITPELYRVVAHNNTAEDEIATGENYEGSVTFSVDVAPGQHLQNVDLTSVLGTKFTIDSVTGTGSVTVHTGKDGGLVADIGGDTSALTPNTDGTLTIRYHIAQNDSSSNAAIIDPNTDGSVTITPNWTATVGKWVPLDTNDATHTNDTALNISGSIEPITLRAVAVQQSVSSGSAQPGGALTYTSTFQVSDYAGLHDVTITENISDGLDFNKAAGTITLSITRNGVTQNFTLDPNDSRYFTFTAADASGAEHFVFNMSAFLADQGQSGDLLGDNLADGVHDGTPTTGTLTFKANMSDVYSDPAGGGQPALNEGDKVASFAVIAGSVLRRDEQTGTVALTGNTISDDTAHVETSVPDNPLELEVYAVNGVVVAPGSTVTIKPGDVVTYRLRYDVTSGDYENLDLAAFLPQPVFDTADPNADGGHAGFVVDSSTAAGGPASGHISYGPTQTAGGPGFTVSADGTSNGLDFTFGDRSDPTNSNYQIDLLFSVTASSQPFADRVLLTAIGQKTDTNTGREVINSSSGITQVTLLQPDVYITKGVVGTDDTQGTYTGGAPVGFSGAGSTGAAFTGTITSDGIAGRHVDSNLTGDDAGDTVRFALTIENRGSSANGAYDVIFKDQLPTGENDPAQVSNLRITLGDGTVIYDGTTATLANITDINGNAFASVDAARAALFGSGIKLVDHADGTGVLGRGKDDSGATVNDGKNIAVVTYDLTLTAATTSHTTYTSDATLVSFSNTDNGIVDTVARTDSASIVTRNPAAAVTLISTSYSGTAGSNVVIGEKAQYQITITVPEGETVAMALQEALDNNLSLVSIDGISASAALSSSAGSFADIMAAATAGADRGGFHLDFGTITNTDTNNGAAETIVITFTAVARDTAANIAGKSDSGTTTVTVGGTSVAAPALPAVKVVEPKVTTVVTNNATTDTDAGDIVTYTTTLTASGGADAQDLVFTEQVPTGMTFLNDALPAGFTYDASTGKISGTLSHLAVGQSFTFSYTAQVNATAKIGDDYPTAATTTWSSLPGTVTGVSTFDTSSTERDGSGGINNYTSSGSTTVHIAADAPVLTLVSTSEPGTGTDAVTGNQDVTVGEVVRYQIKVRVGETDNLNAAILAALPPGLQFLNDGTTRIGYIADTGMTSSTTTLTLVDANGHPIGTLDASNISVDPVSGKVTFNLGELNNQDRDPNDEFIVVEFNALVTNVAGTTGKGVEASTTAQFTANGSSSPSSAPVTVDEVEPNLVIDKSITSAGTTAGDHPVNTVTVTVTNTGNATAYDVSLKDVLGANSTLDPNSMLTITVTAADGSVTSTTTTPGGFASQDFTSLAAGSKITVTYTIDVTDRSQAVATTDATVTYSSLPGDHGTTDVNNTTGSNPTGAPGSVTGERTYSAQDAAGLGAVKGSIWENLNPNAVHDTGETFLAGITVQLEDTSGHVIATTVTDANGNYSFGGLLDGGYKVVVAPNQAASNTGSKVYDEINYDADGSANGNGTIAVNVAAGAVVATRDFGLLPPNTAPAFGGVDGVQGDGREQTWTTIDPGTTIDDRELAFRNDWNGSTITIARVGGASADDLFDVNGASTGAASGALIVGGVTIGQFTNTNGTVVLTFNATATTAQVEAVLDRMQYQNTLDAPPASVQIGFTVNDRNNGDQGSGGPLSGTAVRTIDILAVNDNPINVGPNPPNLSNLDGDGVTVAFDPGQYFADPDNDTLTYTATGLPPGLTLRGDGTIAGTIDHSASQGGVNGDYTVTVTATDPDGLTTSRTFTWYVANPAPTAQPDTGSTDEVTRISAGAGSLLGNDSDPDHDTLTVVGVGTGSNTPTGAVDVAIAGSTGGTFIVHADGSYSFDPGSDFIGLSQTQSRDTTVTYRISDGEGGFADATLTITVHGIDDAPVTTGTNPGPQHSTDSSSPVVTLNPDSYITDPNGDTLAYTVTGLPPGLSYDAGTHEITGTIDHDASQGGTAGVYQVVVTGTDPYGKSTTVGFDWTVTNPPPIAANDVDHTDQNTAITGAAGKLLANDGDPDGDPISVVDFTGAGGTVAAGGRVNGSNGGSFVVNADGSYRFDPGADFKALPAGVSATTSVTYRISDGEGGFASATLTVTVTGTDDASVPLPGAGAVVERDRPTVGGTLTVTDIDSPTPTFTPGTQSGNYGSLTVDANGDWTYTLDHRADPLTQGQKATETFQVTLSDGNVTTVTVDITGVNEAPTVPSQVRSTPEDHGLTGNVLTGATDPDAGTTLAVASFDIGGKTYASGQTATIDGIGTIVVGADGNYVFTPAHDYSGPVPTVTVNVTDGIATVTSKLDITVTPVTDMPVVDAPKAIDILPGKSTTLGLGAHVGDTLTDDAGHEHLTSITISGLADGVKLIGADGSIIAIVDGKATITPDQLTGLQVLLGPTAPRESTIVISATAQDGNAAPETVQTSLLLRTIDTPPMATRAHGFDIPLTQDIAEPVIREYPLYFPYDRPLPEYRALPLHMEPVVYVTDAVRASQAIADSMTDAIKGERPGLFAVNQDEPVGLSPLLKPDHVIYVQMAVRDSAKEARLLEDAIRGRHGVTGLGADGQLSEPTVFGNPVHAGKHAPAGKHPSNGKHHQGGKAAKPAAPGFSKALRDASPHSLPAGH